MEQGATQLWFDGSRAHGLSIEVQHDDGVDGGGVFEQLVQPQPHKVQRSSVRPQRVREGEAANPGLPNS